MTDLIQSLAAAHAALIQDTRTDDAALALRATARKVNSTLVAALKAVPEIERAKYLGPMMASGSLAALKLIPQDAKPRWGQMSAGNLTAAFLLNQDPGFVRETIKRGYKIDESARKDLLELLAEDPQNAQRKFLESIILSGEANVYRARAVIRTLMEMPDSKASAVAGLAVRILKDCLKADPDGMNRDFTAMMAIFDPGAARDTLYRKALIYGLLGAKTPPKEVICHPEMMRLAKALTQRASRSALLVETGGLETYLAGGHRKPPAIIQEFERKRLGWRFNPPKPTRGPSSPTLRVR